MENENIGITDLDKELKPSISDNNDNIQQSTDEVLDDGENLENKSCENDNSKDVRKNKSKKKKFFLISLYESISSNMMLVIALTPISLVYNFFYIVGNLDITVREVYRIALINNVISIILSFITRKFYICFSVTCGSLCFLAFNFFVSDSIEHIDALKETVLFFRRLSISDLNVYIRNNFNFFKQKKSYKRSIDLDNYADDDINDDSVDDVEEFDDSMNIENRQYETVTNSSVEDIDDEELNRLKNKESMFSKENCICEDNNEDSGLHRVEDKQQNVINGSKTIPAPQLQQGEQVTLVQPNLQNPLPNQDINARLGVTQPPKPPNMGGYSNHPPNIGGYPNKPPNPPNIIIQQNSVMTSRGSYMRNQSMPYQSTIPNGTQGHINNPRINNISIDNSANYSGNCINNNKVNEDFSDLD